MEKLSKEQAQKDLKVAEETLNKKQKEYKVLQTQYAKMELENTTKKMCIDNLKWVLAERDRSIKYWKQEMIKLKRNGEQFEAATQSFRRMTRFEDSDTSTDEDN